MRETCWTMIRGAAEGEEGDREAFARRYLSAVTAYLRARWRGNRLQAEVEDAVQEVFVDCFKAGGALERVDPARGGSFRAFLYGVVRYVALRFEERAGRRRERQSPTGLDPTDQEADDPRLSRVFDRAWAKSIVREAGERHERSARGRGERAQRRVELLRLRFQEDLPIREIAKRWEAEPAYLHEEYRQARKEFRRLLLEVVEFHHSGKPEEVEAECVRLVELLA